MAVNLQEERNTRQLLSSCVSFSPPFRIGDQAISASWASGVGEAQYQETQYANTQALRCVLLLGSELQRTARSVENPTFHTNSFTNEHFSLCAKHRHPRHSMSVYVRILPFLFPFIHPIRYTYSISTPSPLNLPSTSFTPFSLSPSPSTSLSPSPAPAPAPLSATPHPSPLNPPLLTLSQTSFNTPAHHSQSPISK